MTRLILSTSYGSSRSLVGLEEGILLTLSTQEYHGRGPFHHTKTRR